MKRPIVLLTGGGTAGHVSVNEALIPVFSELGYEIHYIGSEDGIEKELIADGQPDVTYHTIKSGKFRRYFSVKNITDPFKVSFAVLQAYAIIRKLKPEILFSKGGFVSVPVVLAAKLTRTPVVIHESDVTPGLANKLALPFSKHIFTVFEETLKYVPVEKATCSGAIIRPELFDGKRQLGLQLAGLSGDKPIVIVMGGSQGSILLNNAVRSDLTTILEKYDVIHLCGKGHIDESYNAINGYKQFEYVKEDLQHLLAAADFAVSRAGSNFIFELLALQKPMLLIPLSAEKSRGDQILNANYFKKLGFASVLLEEQLEDTVLSTEFQSLSNQKEQLLMNMKNTESPKTPNEMVELIMKYRHRFN